MHLSEVVFRWIVSFILIYDVHRNVESHASLVYFLWPQEVVRSGRDCYSPILRNSLIHERYRLIHFSKFQHFAEAMSYHLRINDGARSSGSMWRFALDQRSRETFSVNHRRDFEFDFKIDFKSDGSEQTISIIFGNSVAFGIKSTSVLWLDRSQL